ncbi:hypothetical protein IW261DRAFT_1609464, partial [Armillaria novae-zelandiae]
IKDQLVHLHFSIQSLIQTCSLVLSSSLLLQSLGINAGIATKGGISVARLQFANKDINCDALVVGQRICVPSN